MSEIDKVLHEFREMVTGIKCIKTHQSIMYWIAWLRDERNSHCISKAVEALEEKQKREQGCEYCRGVKPCAPHTDIIIKGYNVCPMCGRRLSHE